MERFYLNTPVIIVSQTVASISVAKEECSETATREDGNIVKNIIFWGVQATVTANFEWLCVDVLLLDDVDLRLAMDFAHYNFKFCTIMA